LNRIDKNPIHINANYSEERNQELKNIPDFILKLLIQRGIASAAEVKEFLYPKIASINDPFKIANMAKAVDRLVTAYEKQQVVAVYGDYDLDGTFGLVILKEGLNKLGFKNVIPIQPFRHHDGYGLHAHYVEELKQKYNVDLIVTVDVGITANEACLKAKELGVDVIITDHHLAQEILPEAYCIINPNQPNDSSGLKYLCGAGVGLYLIRALRKQMMDKGFNVNLDIKELLPYYAVATITDMVPLIADNRLLLKFAFECFKNVNNVGLKSLLTKLDLQNKKLDTEDIGIKLAPKINALGRLEKDKKPMELLFIENEVQASNYVDSLLDLNIKRRSLQDLGVKEVQKYIEDNKLEDRIKQDEFLFFFSDVIHPGVTGLIANHFMNELGLPCLIGSVDNNTKRVTSSGRKPDTVAGSLVDLMTSLKSDTCDGGGHACAVGFEFHVDESAQIHKQIEAYFKTIKTSDGNTNLVLKPQKSLTYDIELTWKDIHFKNYLWLEFLEPFGVGFPEPKFLIKNVSFIQLSMLKNKHFKLVAINSSANEKVDFLLFNPSPYQKRLITEGIDNLDVVVKIKKDKFRNQNKIQLLIEDICKHEFIKA
jgi:single-stranded-DNA-specific exonuclease